MRRVGRRDRSAEYRGFVSIFVVRIREAEARLHLASVNDCGARSGEKIIEKKIENSSTLAQWTVEKQLAIRIKNVENEIRDGDIAPQSSADSFSPKALLECAERKGS